MCCLDGFSIFQSPKDNNSPMGSNNFLAFCWILVCFLQFQQSMLVILNIGLSYRLLREKPLNFVPTFLLCAQVENPSIIQSLFSFYLHEVIFQIIIIIFGMWCATAHSFGNKLYTVKGLRQVQSPTS